MTDATGDKNFSLTGFNLMSYSKCNEMHEYIYFTPNVSDSKMKDKDTGRIKILFIQTQCSEGTPTPTQQRMS